MTGAFTIDTIEEIAKRLREPSWLTELRRAALRTHTELPWPHPSDDIWRRTNVSLLDPGRGFSPAEPALLQSLRLSEVELAGLTRPLGDESLLVRANGAWLVPPEASGVMVEELTAAARAKPEPIRAILESDGLTEAERKLASLNAAFHHDDLVVRVPAGMTVERPVRLVRAFSIRDKEAIFPMTLITVGAGGSVTLIEESISFSPPAPGATQAETGREPDRGHLINNRIELVLEPEASVRYVRLQRWDARAREFLLQRATLAKGASLTMANLTLGAALSKTHVVTKLMGPGASTKIYGFVFGHGRQHVDQHTLQDHHSPHTTSDLQYRAALQDESRMVYTGLIRIAKAAAQTNAYQANHNLLLSRTARAETIPMLEILADDVQCKHGASIGPVDDEQAFYLMSRGVPREAAQRLLVMGFIEPVLQQIPFAPLQERLREEIEGCLHNEAG
ncbi:MAG: Fe-S cluster assembly protein SufD [Omnitrophica WOR_2 bacterium RIFCSPHIGHO2_02_FULL_67_20]|nr:MAG: Fe-S cluster assembly protein SufD [Omnitrophica WOR_2 bacterium RIFCSPHIGHO2_02_FULL_67_20]